MEISLSYQLITFGASVILGGILGVVYELFRTVRSLFGGRTAAVFFQDILFWVASAFVVYTFFLLFTNGTVRYFVLLGAGAGFVIYMKTLGRFTAFLFRRLFRPIKYAINAVIKASRKLFNLIFSYKKRKNFQKTLETPSEDVV